MMHCTLDNSVCVLKIIHIAFVVLAGSEAVSSVCGVRRFLSGLSMALCLSNCCLIHRNCLSYILSCICMQPVRCRHPCTHPLIIYFYPALSSQPATFYPMLLYVEFLNFDIDTFEKQLENKLNNLLRLNSWLKQIFSRDKG